MTGVLRARPYRDEDDFWRVRALLREILMANGRRLTGWHVVRWDYWRWHGIENCHWQDIGAVVHLWEDPAGVVRAAVTSDGPGTAFFQIHPDVDGPIIRHAMLGVAEASCPDSRRGPERPALEVWVPGDDHGWADLLTRRGYERNGMPEDLRTRVLTPRMPVATLPAGYRIRPLGGDEDFPARGDLSLAVFHPIPDGSTAMDAAAYRNVQRGPLYRRDLDLVAVAPDGGLAGFATVWLDDVTRTGFFEPVGVHPAHRRLGLGRALLLEGMARLAWYGAQIAYTASYGPTAGALYASVGLASADRLEPWTMAPPDTAGGGPSVS